MAGAAGDRAFGFAFMADWAVVRAVQTLVRGRMPAGAIGDLPQTPTPAGPTLVHLPRGDASSVAKPIRNREARVTMPHVA